MRPSLSILTVLRSAELIDTSIIDSFSSYARPFEKDMDTVKQLIEWAATGIEVFTVVVIVTAIVAGTARFLMHLNQRVADAFRTYKTRLGKMLILSLELLVAADIIRTVVLEPTLVNAAVLGVLVLIRTFLSWSLSVEVEGHWPWLGSAREESE